VVAACFRAMRSIFDDADTRDPAAYLVQNEPGPAAVAQIANRTEAWRGERTVKLSGIEFPRVERGDLLVIPPVVFGFRGYISLFSHTPLDVGGALLTIKARPCSAAGVPAFAEAMEGSGCCVTSLFGGFCNG